MRIEDIVTPDPQFISPDDSIEQAAQRMKAFDIGMLPIMEDDHLVGTVTDRDIAIRGVAEGRDLRCTKVREIMTVGAVSCFDDQKVIEGARLMAQNQVRRLPVLNRFNQLVGIVSLGDLAVRAPEEQLVGEVLQHISEPTRLEALTPVEA